MKEHGIEAEKVLGRNPDHDTAKFKQFQLKHLGQYAIPLFDGFEIPLMPPCGLHLILAHHRYLWSALLIAIINRQQTLKIFEAFKSIGCCYLAMQMEAYYNKKSKYYDGSQSLKMIGEDCKKMEKIYKNLLIVSSQKKKGRM